MCDEVGSLMMSKVRGKVEPQEEIEPGIVSPQLGGRQPTFTFHNTRNSWTIKRRGQVSRAMMRG